MKTMIKFKEKLQAHSSPLLILLILLMYDYWAVYHSVFGFNKKILVVHMIFNANSFFAILPEFYFKVRNKFILNILPNFYCFNVFVCIMCLWILGLPSSDLSLSLLMLLIMTMTATKLFIEILVGVREYVTSIRKNHIKI